MFWQKDENKKAKEKKLNDLKWETAKELGLDIALQDPKAMSAKDAGKIGGHMSRKLLGGKKCV